MNRTSIPWVQNEDGSRGFTWNLWTGCLHGCGYCYAKPIATRFGKQNKNGAESIWRMETMPTKHAQGGFHTVYVAKDGSQPFPMGWAPTYYPAREEEPLKLRTSGNRIFAGSMTDPFGDWVPRLWRVRLFAIMAAAKDQTFILLTKDPENAAAWLNDPGTPDWVEREAGEFTHSYDGEWPLKNVWLLTSVENQAAADKRIPHILRCPAAVRGVSIEPMLGQVRLDHMDVEAAGHDEWCFINALTGRQTDMGRPCPDVPHLDWVICGGQTGPGAKPLHPDHVRRLRNQCHAAGTAFYFKSWGESIVPEDGARACRVCGCTEHNACLDELTGGGCYWVEPDLCSECIGKPVPTDDRPVKFRRVGTRRSGDELDGKTYHEFPKTTAA